MQKVNKNLLLVQNGFPGSKTSGTEVDSLDIRNFFKYEKDVTPSEYASYQRWYLSDTSPFKPFNFKREDTYLNANEIRQTTIPSQWYEKTGELKYNNSFKHYSVSFLLFAVRMKKGFLGSNITVASRLPSDHPLKLRFYDLGESLEAFKAINKMSKIYCSNNTDYYNWRPHKILSNGIVIPTLTQYNHCFLAALFSDSVYTKESGSALLTNEPLLNVSWTETEFIEG